MAAKLTQLIYGTSSHAAVDDILPNHKIVSNIITHMQIISAKAQPGCCNLKNIIDQKKLSVNCTANNMMAVCFMVLSASLLQTKNNAMPISKYNVVHTGANIQLGGLNQGLIATANHPLTPDDVK